MSETKREIVTRDAVVPASPDIVRAIVADLQSWPQYHPPAVHAEILDRDPSGTLVQHWAVADDTSVRTWRARWELDTDEHRIRFAHLSPPPPLRSLDGEWIFGPGPDGTCRASLSHTLTYAATDQDRVRSVAAAIARNTQALLDTARDTATRAEELRSLVISFQDTVFIGGLVRDAYAFLHDAAAWPDRLPHVVRLDLQEPAPGVQFFDMDTKAPDGSTHSTRSVRICLPHHLIVYKQLVPPALLDAHTGHWSFVETPEGVLAMARHTATIKRSALCLLGETATVMDARRYLRRVLSGHSVRNLHLAKDYAQELAGV